MKHGLRLWIVAWCAALFWTAGCKATEPTIVQSPLVSISIRPSSPSAAPNTTMLLQAIGIYSNNAQVNLTTSVSWASANPGVATVDARGGVTILGPGSSTITASFQNITGSTVLTSSPLASIALTPADPTIASGTAVQFSALGTLQNSATQGLTSFASWSSSDTGIATISSSGLASAAATTTGSATITATFAGITGSTSLTSAAVTSLSVSPASATVGLGTTQQFTATGTLTGGATQNLTANAVWSSSTPSVATIGTGTASAGLAVSVAPGSTSITASFGGATSNSAVLTVTPAVLSAITITPSNPSIAVGKTQQFTATGSFSDNSTRDITASVTWTSSNTQTATMGNTAGTTGLATAIATGTTTVSASLGGVTSNTVTLNVTAAVLTSITISPPSPTINISNGNGLQLRALGVFSDNTAQDLTSTVSWTSSNTSVATISTIPGSQGFVTAITAGTTTITATFGTIVATSLLTVTF